MLDLDETLISAQAQDEWNHDKYKHLLSQFPVHDMEGYYYIFERPHLQSFLDWLFANFNVCVWTAATKDYACFIIKHVLLKNKDRKLDYVFFGDHCDISDKEYACPKSLEMLWNKYKMQGFTAKNTIIIDDHPGVKEGNDTLCYHIKEFDVLSDDSRQDIELERLKEFLSDRI